MLGPISASSIHGFLWSNHKLGSGGFIKIASEESASERCPLQLFQFWCIEVLRNAILRLHRQRDFDKNVKETGSVGTRMFKTRWWLFCRLCLNKSGASNGYIKDLLYIKYVCIYIYILRSYTSMWCVIYFLPLTLLGWSRPVSQRNRVKTNTATLVFSLSSLLSPSISSQIVACRV